MKRSRFFAVVVAGLVFATAARAQDSQTVSADDTARFLAGMQVSPDSPLAQLAQDPGIKQHNTYFDVAFGKVGMNQLAKVRAWSAINLTAPKPVMFYMFGGPDFLYADAFFPSATTYVLSGLEPVGQIPDLTKLPRASIVQTLRNIQGSLRTVLNYSYFITDHMSQDLSSGPVNGTLPILYVFLARSGKSIHDVNWVYLDEQGALHPGEGARPRAPARGVKISFSEDNGPRKTLYYFSTNLEDERGRSIALLQFAKSLGEGDSFIKSASYLMHNSSFSQVRNFVLDNSSLILQDDTGVPARLFDTSKWQLRPFGRYVNPIPVFEGMYQWKLSELYQKNKPNPIDFGLGYHWQAHDSNLLVAIRILPAPEVAASISKDEAQRETAVVTIKPVKVETTAATIRPANRVPPARPYRTYPTRQQDAPINFFPFALFFQPVQP